jgi:hypothetical protein
MQEKFTKFVRLTGAVNLKIRSLPATACSFGADVFPSRLMSSIHFFSLGQYRSLLFWEFLFFIFSTKLCLFYFSSSLVLSETNYYTIATFPILSKSMFF